MSPTRFGAFTLGVVMLQTRFPRLPGDIGNPQTFPFQTLYRTVESATVPTVVRSGLPETGTRADIVAAARDLAASGADLIATSCGFLAGIQKEIQAEVDVPVIASALSQLPILRQLFGRDRPIGILTFDPTRLAPVHFGDLSDDQLVIDGLLPGDALFRAIAEDLPELEQTAAEAGVVAAARRLVGREPAISAIVCECTNFSPYRDALIAAVDRPVFDINQAILWFATARAADRP